MARLGVTKDDVFAACKTLLKDGMNLTVANVREELGTGSYTTILPLIDQFRTSMNEEAVKPDDSISGMPNLPSELSDQGAKLIQDIWSQATTQAQKQINEITLQFKKELGDLAETLNSKTEELDQAVTDLTSLETEFEQARQESEKRVRALSEKDGEISLLKSQLKEKDQEMRSYLERAVAAEQRIELSKAAR